jgi:voltage-gated potassium channel
VNDVHHTSSHHRPTVLGFLGVLFSGRYVWLLSSLIGLMIVGPSFGSYPLFTSPNHTVYISDLVNAGFLFIAIQTYHHHRVQYWSLIGLAVVSIALGVGARVLGDQWLVWLGVPALFASGLILVAIGLLIGTEVFTKTQVDGDAICGSISVYMLIGVIFASGYSMILLANPEAFSISEKLRLDDPSLGPHRLMLYFSLVTLTTVGYGDITPVSDLARSLSNVEAILGQTYLTVLVARLVGKHLAKSLADEATT